jgi:thioredoxin reductase/NAD-dependent dihydropyrimidine dehydrogenase PreA subunit
MVRADLCAGCATCVAACPEANAIRVEAKIAIVDLAYCVGHGDCAAACPVGAIALSTGSAVQRVEVPQVNAHFETTVPGVYVVGELGGRGLIKNAVNEGKVAAEHVASVLPPGAPRRDGRADAFDLVIVGSGPAGLSAGLEAHRQGLRYVILEQGSLADTVRKYPRHKLLFAEPLRVPLYGDLWVSDASKESLLKVWETIVRTTGLNVVTQQRVEGIQRVKGLFALVAGPQTWFARRIILALGRRGTPRRLEVPGEELAKVVYDIAEMEDFAHRRVLVVGGGDSAIESAVGLAHQAGTTVHLSYRGDGFGRAKVRNQEKLAAQVNAGRIHLLLRSQVRTIEPSSVVIACDGKELELPNDDVVVRIGGEAPYALLERMGVGIVAKDLALPQETAKVA